MNFAVDESRLPRYHREAREWIRTYPKVWAYMVEQALSVARQGRRFGMKALVEHVRWRVQFQWGGEYKLNNNHTAYLGDELVARYPEIRDHLERRLRRAA